MVTGDHASRYESDSGDGRLVVKVWNSLRRGDARRDHALLAMLEAASSVKAVPMPGAAQVEACGLSPVGPFLVTRYADGEELLASSPETTEQRLALMGSIVAAVTALHARGLAHGDLHPANIIVSGGGVTLIDMFDVSPLGEGRIRSMAWAPADHERRSDQQIDRYAVCRLVVALCGGDEALAALVGIAETELGREVIETLQPVSEAIELERRRLLQPAPREFRLRAPNLNAVTVEGDEGQLWVKGFGGPDGREFFFLTGLTRRVLIKVRNGVTDGVELMETQFRDLAQGVPLAMSLSMGPGAEFGAEELVRFLKSAIEVDEPAPAAAPPIQDDLDEEGEDAALGEGMGDDEPADHEPHIAFADSRLDVERMWLRASEIEDETALQARLDRRAPDIGSSAAYQFESNRPIEFDDDDAVEVRLGGVRGRRLGMLDLARCDDRQLAIKDMRVPIAEGEYVTLVDRRDRVSKERRRRAVERITDRRGVIANLIDYFDPAAQLPDIPYRFDVSDDELKAYGLNLGQRTAFRRLLSCGPVGLLQGPPGSGKTLFIAALAHWLLKRGGARRVLIASQSHEAVNNVLEQLLKTYRRHGGNAELLRVGSRGATERVRPYQAKSLRERYRVRFENGLKTRVAHAAAAMGISRSFVHDVVDVDLKLGVIQRSLEMATSASAGDLDRDERKRSETRIRTLRESFSAIASAMLDRPIDLTSEKSLEVVEDAYAATLRNHSRSSPGDLVSTRKLLALSHEWRDTLSSGHRNFDEFLAKTRSVVAGTCVGLGQSQIRLEEGSFDWVIVDEAARCTSGELAVPLQMGSRVVLVGDQRQLRPMVDREVQLALRDEMRGVPRQELEQSDFERAFASEFGQRNSMVLNEQYRMAPAISDLVSEVFYRPHGVELRPSEEREPDAAFVDLKGDLAPTMVWFDTAGMPGAGESERNFGRDVWNDAEIEGVLAILSMIAADTTLAEELARRNEPAIGVICMYSEQKRRLEREWSQRPFPEAFRRTVTIDTVDAYQGKENAIVIVSLVRSNAERRPFHVGRENRCNVALSRAKERLYVVGDTAMWGDARNRSPMRQVLKRMADLPEDVAVVAPVKGIGR